jgi:hypothetical protein
MVLFPAVPLIVLAGGGFVFLLPGKWITVIFLWVQDFAICDFWMSCHIALCLKAACPIQPPGKVLIPPGITPLISV